MWILQVPVAKKQNITVEIKVPLTKNLTGNQPFNPSELLTARIAWS